MLPNNLKLLDELNEHGTTLISVQIECCRMVDVLYSKKQLPLTAAGMNTYATGAFLHVIMVAVYKCTYRILFAVAIIEPFIAIY